MRRTITVGMAAAALLATLGGCVGRTPPPTYVIRHFDTPEGVRDAQLTPTGQARARALVRWFQGKPLSAVLSTPTDRTRNSAAPLAAARGLPIATYDPTAYAALVERVRKTKGAVLVVGHSNTVPDIVAALGGTRPAPLSHPDFGDIWIVEGERTRRERIDP